MMKDFTVSSGGLEKETGICDLFEIQVRKTPDLTAVWCDSREISYSELNRKSDLLSVQLRRMNPEGSLVGISSFKNIEMIIGLLAILKAGKAYLPLDASHPPVRTKQLIQEAGIQTCLCTKTESDFFGSLGTNMQLLVTDNIYTEETDKKEIPAELAYVLFTSGSTGIPKGVCMTQRSMVNLLNWQKNHSVAGEGTKTLQFAPLGFDVSFQEIFSTITTGGELVLVDEDRRLDPYLLLAFIEERSVQRIFFPFVALQMLTEAANNYQLFPASIREIITAGEQLKITPQIIRFFSGIPSCILYNQYGPTETHVVTALKMEGNPKFWPDLPSIGYPIDKTEIHFLDENENEVPDGEAGEICISGESLAKGYLNQPGLTAEKFIQWNRPATGKLRLYKTGDLGRRLPDGKIEFSGRRDEQVKIRGYRVEPAEIEIFLNQQTDIQQAVVIAREDQPGEKKLVAYLISSNGIKNTSQIHREIESHLPDYMIPSAFVWMEKWPKTPSGKIDRKSLPRPERTRPELSVLYKKPVTEIEKNICSCWAGILELDQVGVLDNFFELGGNSLLALKTVAALKQAYQYSLPVTRIYQNPTAAALAACLTERTDEKVAYSSSFGSGTEIAVIAMAGRFPGAPDVEEFWNNLKDGKESISFFSLEELDTSLPDSLKNNPDYVKARGIIDQAEAFDAAFFGISPRLAELMDPQQRIFLEIAWEALEDSGYIASKNKGTIGVFAGTGNNTYYLNNVLGHQHLIDQVGSFQVMTANEKDYIASRTAYELNLKGPAVSVHSACSTSLLAIAEAVESIRKGQCDMALAGGVSVTVPVKSGHIYQEGSMYSKDGHNRSFDAEAAGTVFSDGAGVVLLKNLEQAIKDGDTIYSVIKGIGLNNDGGGKGSFTAPSAEGQAGAIRMAFRDARIDPANISYIEAHGTATPLGDPIEVEGLNLAFGLQEKKQYCALGSVKSNIGHCTAAAGIAGFIKTCLALYHKKIPATVNFKKPNPHIHFEEGPFYVNNRLRDWEVNGSRIAGVSSFGVGGTNVHVVLEEFLNPETAKTKSHQQNRPLQLFSWSAKTETSLETYAGKLANYVQAHEMLNLADLAFSLQTTRERFNIRRFLVAGDRSEFLLKLKSPPSSREHFFLKDNLDGIVFVFPGQGSQFINMGRELYEQEPVFRQAFDICAELLEPMMKEDIRDIIFPAQINSVTERKIHNTYYTQPALFTIEYAIAKLWISWGIYPTAFIGHSIGEFVAAHLAGVFTLEEGLKLIFTRGRMMSALPAGCMLSVRSGEEKIKSLLPEDLSLAAVNGPNLSVISGPEQRIIDFSDSLTALGISNKLLETSHAFHSAMMDPILKEFEGLVTTIEMKEPQIPIVSTLTGNWIRPGEITVPKYWSDQLRLPVRFSGAVQTISDKGNHILLESGPGRVLTTLIRHQGIKKGLAAVSSLEGEDGQSDLHAILNSLGQLWIKGAEPDWKMFYREQNREVIRVPSYAFDRIRCWVDPVVFKADQQKNLQSLIIETKQQETSLSSTVNNAVHKSGERKANLIEKLRIIFENASGIEMKTVNPETHFIEIGFDSLLLTQVALNCKKEFGHPISFRQLNESLTSLDLLAGYLAQLLPEEVFLEESDAATPANPTSIQYLSTQIEMLAKQVADLQKVEKPSTVIREQSAINPGSSKKELSTEEMAELKKPFGATARIEKHSTALDRKQQVFLDELTRRYNKKTKLSKEYTQRHRACMADPRVVSGFKPLTKELVYSIVVNKSRGSRLWDIDGNEYIDALNGFGSNFLGYQPESVTRALHQQIENGYELGPQHELAGKVCKLICEFTNFDRSALCNTGSEAVLGAMRIARTVTGRSIIVAFSGSYHGIVDEVIVRGTKNLKSFPAAPGIMPEAVQNMLILEYGTEESLKIIAERAHELAAVLVEPVQSRRPEFQPVEFLKSLRKITSGSGTALIFDEVITGFRMHPGGAQALFGVQADLGTYGKVVAGGLPIGVIAGKKLFMDALDGGFWEYGNASVPESGVTYFAGTFVRHPLALAASMASLEYMKSKGPSLQKSINEKTGGLSDALNQICVQKGIAVYVARFGSLWKIKFKEEIPYGELLFTLMREKGIHIWDGFPCFLTEAHDAADVKAITDKFRESVDELLEAGFLTSSQAIHYVPSIEPQMEIWLSCLLGGADASRSYNESVSLRLNGQMNLSAMEQALKEITIRHEALRATFSEDGRQIIIHRDMPLQLRIENLADQTLQDQEAFISSFTKQNAQEVFDLLKGPLFRADLFKLGDEEYYLTLSAHHIICDGWSLGIILQDLGKYYSAKTGNITPEIKPAPSLSEYAALQTRFSESEEYKKIERYWLEQFRENVPVLDIPTDFPRPQVRTYKSQRIDFPLDADLVNNVRKLGTHSGCTLVTTLMAAYEVFLHRLTGQKDIILGIPAAGQSITGLYGLVGHCVNLLPMRSRPEGEMLFSEYLGQRKSQILNDYDHQQITFGALLQKLNTARDPSRVPLVPLTFNVELGLDDGVEFPGLNYEMIYNPRAYENFEISLNIGGSVENVDVQWSFNSQLFKPSTIRMMMKSFENLLHRVVADPAIRIMDIPVPDLKQAVADEPDTLYPKDRSIATLFSEQARKTPFRRALSFGNRTYTYRQLDEKSNQLANYLKLNGVKREDRIPVCLEKSMELIIAVLGILKAGGAYVPIDPEYPVERIRFILEDVGARMILCNRKNLDALGSSDNLLIILLDEEWNRISRESVSPPPLAGSGKDLAYVMYTSGSTGRPKGVMIENYNVVSLVRGISYVNLAGKNVLLNTGSVSFDASSFEFWSMLLNGGELVLCPQQTLLNSEFLKQEIRKRKVNIMWFTSSLLNQWVELDIGVFEGLRTVIAGGEKLSEKHIEKLRNRYPSLEIINGYGPTENTTFSLTYLVKERQITKPIPIGKPLNNRTAYVLNNQFQLCGVGVIGELYVGGAGVGRGYLNRPDLTKERFLPDPFSPEPGAKMYRTGDLSRQMPDGNLEFCGRLDDQVKIRGFRIEPAEIESAILQFPGVEQTVVIAREDRASEKKLIAYIVSQETFNKEDIILFLQSKLPAYMVPRTIIPLNRLPLNANGKLDKKALPDPDLLPEFGNRKIKSPETETQIMLADIWKEALHLQQLSIDDNFFELGGHSLVAVRVMKMIEEKSKYRLPITALFEAPTVEKLSLLLERDDKKGSWNSLVQIKPGGDKPPLYIVHGSGLTVLIFHALAMGLDPDQPVFGLQARGLNGIDEPFDNMEEIAAYYVGEILEQNPHGPYNLAGYSFGGIVAFEMAKQLKAIGKEVNMLAIFDTNADHSSHFDDWALKMSKKFKRQFPKFRFILRSLKKYPAETISYQFNFMKTKFVRLLAHAGVLKKASGEEEHLDFADKINYKHDIAFEKYKLQPYNGSIDLFRVKSRMYFLDDPVYLGWKPYVLQGINIHEISGDHKTFLLAPNVQELSRVLSEILNERNAGKEIKKDFTDPSTVLKAI